MILRWFILGLFLCATFVSRAVELRPQGGKAGPKITFETGVKPLLSQYCYGCHGEKKKGGLDLRIYTDGMTVKRDREVFEKVLNNLQSHEMPPENKPQPSLGQRELIANWIQSEVLGCDCNHPDPGRVTIRRLNRAEYNTTIRDLVEVNFQPAEDFPADDVGYGFDNIGDVLSLSPLLMEKYAIAAEKILDMAIVTGTNHGIIQKYGAARFKSSLPGEVRGDGIWVVYAEGDVSKRFEFPKDGRYILRIKAAGQQAGPDPARMEIRLDGAPIKVMDVRAVESSPQVYEVVTRVRKGPKRLAGAFINDYYNADDPNPNNRDRNLLVESMEVVGPLDEPLPESHRRIFARQPTPKTTNEVARSIIAQFTKRAYRRPVTGDEVERLFRLFQMAQKDGESFETSMKLPLEAVLVSPNFLFRGELQSKPNDPRSQSKIGEYALASRLSYFLWSSMPDNELFDLADKGKLRRNLDGQVKRMLKDAKAHALVDNFANQWLQIRNLSMITPDHAVFPEFNDELRASMAKETESFFEYVMQQDRSILDFIDSDYTFVNEPLARLYGITGVSGNDFQRVNLKGHERGGLLTQASILTVTSVSTRTSPVKRGKWVLENILGTPPPPPPANVPPLKNDHKEELTGTLRQRMVQHREDPNCASCHARMDPIGFGFENYNGIGGWRARDGKFDVNASAELISGDSFNGAAEFKSILLNQKREAFVRCLSEKMLTYALGRGLEFYDKCAVDQISKQVAANQFKFSSVVLGAVKSTPFQMRRGEADKTAELDAHLAKGN
jgi:hypothetical protein